MVEHFTLSELHDLCFELGINWEQLSGDTLDSKTTALLERLNRQARMPVLLVKLHALRPSVIWALDDLDEAAAPPYKGLAFYERQDAGLFFGREHLIGELLVMAGRLSFVTVVGKSGSGKSSIVRAGVVPALRGDRPPPEAVALPPDSLRWAYLEMTPTGQPVEQLAIMLTRDLATAADTQAVLNDLRTDPATASIYLRKYLERQSAPRAFLLVDQFEELYTACKDENARAAFIAGLLAVARSGRATLFVTVRADFLHHFIDHPHLWEVLDKNKLVIRAMNEVELREAVEQPALTTAYELEPGLADVIVRDVGQDAATLPLLSHALLETWRRREGWLLTHAGYNAAGGVGGAIAKTAERTYAGLDEKQQAIARRIFLELTELGEGAEDTRRSVSLTRLLPSRAEERAAAEVVLDSLYRARLVSADDKAAQVTHEALIREWPALREWLNDEREGLRLERRLEEAATVWDAGGRGADYLYGGAQLAAAVQWARDNPDNVEATVANFLAAATAEEEREAAEREAARRQRERLTRRAFVGVSAFAALAMLAAVFAFLQRNTAIDSEATAVAAQSTTAFEATRAEVNLNEAVAARATSDFNESQAEIERDNAVTALNDSNARLLLNLSNSVFESDPLLADRLLLEAVAVAGSNAATREAADALAKNLLTSRAAQPITASVTSFTDVHTGTVYAVNYQLGNDGLISGATGAPITTLNGDVGRVTPVADSPFFFVHYFDAPPELRRTDDEEQIVTLNGDVQQLFPIPDSPFFVVDYFNGPGELRRMDDEELIVTLNGDVTGVTPIADSSFFFVQYSDAWMSELRRTDDIENSVLLNGRVSHVTPIPNGLFFVIHYYDAPGELRRMDDSAVVLLGVTNLHLIPDSPFFVVDYLSVSTPDELRRTDNEGQIIPLNGTVWDVTSISDTTFFLVEYEGAPGELRRTDNGESVFTFNGDAFHAFHIPDSPFFVVQYSDAPYELRRTDDGEISFTFNGNEDNVIPIPDSPLFIVDYSDVPGELRRTDEPTLVMLAGDVEDDGVTSIPDSPFFVVDYFRGPGELRRTDDPAVIPLAGDIKRDAQLGVFSLPNSPFFVVDYSDAPGELRRMATGNVVTDESGRRIAREASVLTADRGFFRLGYQDDTSEIVSGERALVDLGQGVAQSIYFPETNRVAVLYSDGQVVYVDLNLIEAIGGADAAETLAAMSPEELVAFTCDTLFTDNPEWDEAKLEAYLVDFLPEWEPQACGA